MSKTASTICLTMDQDWVPEALARPLLEGAAARGHKVTLFATQATGLEPGPHLELGIHPNLMADSTQGGAVGEILDNLMGWVPGARGARTHRTFWYANLVEELTRRGVIYDSSFAMPLHPNLEAVAQRGLARLAIWWSESIHFDAGLPARICRARQFAAPGLKVFVFHPIHLLLNTPSMAEYRRVAPLLGPMAELTMGKVAALAHRGFGVRDLWEGLLDDLTAMGLETKLMAEVAAAKLAEARPSQPTDGEA